MAAKDTKMAASKTAMVQFFTFNQDSQLVHNVKSFYPAYQVVIRGS